MKRVSPSRLWDRVAERLGTDRESAQLEVLLAAGYSWCAPTTTRPRPPFPLCPGRVPDFRSANFRATVADHLRDRLPPATIRRDDSTGELTSWPINDRPEPRSPPPEAPDGARVSSPIDLCGSPEGSNRAVSETPSPTPLRARLGAAAARTMTTPEVNDENEEIENEPASASRRAIDATKTSRRRGHGVQPDVRLAAGQTGDASRPKKRRLKADNDGGDGRDDGGGAVELEDRLGEWIKRDDGLYERILLMKTVDVDDLAAALKADGGDKENASSAWTKKVPRTKLLAYLESEGVAVVSTKSRRGNKTHF